MVGLAKNAKPGHGNLGRWDQKLEHPWQKKVGDEASSFSDKTEIIRVAKEKPYSICTVDFKKYHTPAIFEVPYRI